MLPNGIEVRNLTKANPGNGVPRFVKEQAETRGYGDSVHPLSLYITEDDIERAFIQVAQGNGAACVMAQAGYRLGAQAVYFYRTTAWVDFGSGPILRFMTSNNVHEHVIKPFDDGDRSKVKPGIYPLLPPTKSDGLKAGRAKYHRRRAAGYEKPKKGTPKNRTIRHTERVVLASRAS